MELSNLLLGLNKLQDEMLVWQQHNFPNSGSHVPLLGALEELGELAHAHIKGEQNIRHSPEEIESMRYDAVADVVIYLADYCNRFHINMGECIESTWNKVMKRDWQKNPQDADKKVCTTQTKV